MIELDKSKALAYDFSKCMIDVSVSTPGDLLRIYPELSAYDEFKKAERDEEIKIAILISDAGSPFNKIKEIKQKVIAVFEFLQLDLGQETNAVLFESIISYTNERIFPMCGIYLQMQNNHNFTYWWNMNQLYYSLMSEMGKPRGPKEDVGNYVTRNLKIQKQADPILQDLLTIEATLFSDSKMKAAIARSKLTLVRTYAEMYADENQTE